MALLSSYPTRVLAKIAGVDASNLVGLATASATIREKVTANRTYYVRTDGSDSNDGLANTAGGAFLTIQKALDTAAYSVDAMSVTTTIQIADGTYAEGGFYGQAYNYIVINGNPSTPSNVLINGPSTGSGADAFVFANGVIASIAHLKITNSTPNGDALHVSSASQLFFENIVFGSVLANHIDSDLSANIYVNGNYSIVGGAGSHMAATYGGIIQVPAFTVTLSGTPAFSNQFAYADQHGVINAAATYSGGATGKRYTASLLGSIATGGAGINYFPGNVAGTGTNPGTTPYGLYT